MASEPGDTLPSPTPPPPPMPPVRPNESVLDELSRAFGVADGVTDLDTEPEAATPAEPEAELEAATSAEPDAELDTAVAEAVGDGEPSTGSRPVAERSTIAIGGDDELPDAVYIEGDLDDGDGSGGTVFIDDDGTGDAIAPKDATGAGIEPRIRQRRIGVRRAAGLKRLRWIIAGVIVAVVVIGTLAVLGSGLFAVEEVDVTGAVYTRQDKLDEIIDDLVGTPVLRVDTADVEDRLRARPWVEDARVRTDFPNRVTIEIRERTPVATMRGSDGLFRVLDAEGRVLDAIEGQPVALVLIAGPGQLDLFPGDFAQVGYASAASLVTKLTPTIRPRVQYIEVTRDGSELNLVLGPTPDPVDPGVDGGDGAGDGAGDGDLLDSETESIGPDPSTFITVRFGSATGDSEQIEKLVRLEKQLDDLPDTPISEINVSTAEVTVL